MNHTYSKLLILLSGFWILIPACRSTTPKASITQAEEDPNAYQRIRCASTGLVWNSEEKKCSDPMTYCLGKKDGSRWNEDSLQCESPKTLCEKDPSHLWHKGECQSYETFCKNQNPPLISYKNQCLSQQSYCEQKGYRYHLNQSGKCVSKSFKDYCLNPNTPKTFLHTVSILTIFAGSQDCHKVSKFFQSQTELRIIAKDLLKDYDATYNATLSTEVQLKELGPLSSFGKLEKLELTGNQIEDITPLKELNKLRYLDLQSNQIQTLEGLEHLQNLEELYLGYNAIIDLTPLAKLNKLKHLSIFANRVSDLSPLKNLKSLQTLKLRGNPINSIYPLAALPRLKSLDLKQTPISERQFTRIEENCPTSQWINKAVRDFCRSLKKP